MGLRLVELYSWRTEGSSRAPKRETRFLATLSTIGNAMWKAIFGRSADAIEKSVSMDDECKLSIVLACCEVLICAKVMIIENDPAIIKYISISRDMSSLSCAALTAGIVEAILDGLGFVSLRGRLGLLSLTLSTASSSDCA
jgi:trafficking protein particle complex subunit 5